MCGQSCPPDSGDERKEIRVGSRQSSLAMIQTNYVIDLLKKLYPSHEFHIVTMETIGDKNLEKALPEIGDKGLFTQELESALMDQKVDFIVHSLKDLPTSLPANCSIGAILEREDPSDVLVLRQGLEIEDPFSLITGLHEFESEPESTDAKDDQHSKRHPVIGSSSMRRQSQLKRFNPHVKIANVRGNINTRLQKLDGVWVPPPGKHAQHYDALILAASGLKRGRLGNRISYRLGQPDATNGSQDWYYAVGQGALTIECRQHDEFIHRFLSPLTHRRTIYETLAERSLLYHLEGGCSVPIGVRIEWKDVNDMTLKAAIFSPDGKTKVSGEITGTIVTSVPGDHESLKKKRKLEDDQNLIVGLPILPSYCPVLRSNYGICFNMGQTLARQLSESGGDVILHQIREEKEKAKSKRVMSDSTISTGSSDDANSSFEHM